LIGKSSQNTAFTRRITSAKIIFDAGFILIASAGICF
jgi:hypothetical protein